MAQTTIQADIQELISQIQRDPGCPVPNPSVSTWQIPEHPDVASIQSNQLPETTDFAIIGSGVTGCSVAVHLLGDPFAAKSKITVFDARRLTSGATGRNGGHLTSNIPALFTDLTVAYGVDMAMKIARYCDRTLKKMYELAESGNIDLLMASEVRRVESMCAFLDNNAMDHARDSITSFVEHLPEHKDGFEFLSAGEIETQYGVQGAVGGVRRQAGAFWPYRLITRIWANLLAEHACRLKIETNTPVLNIEYQPEVDAKHPYSLSTPRGSTRAAKIIHCTNGWSGHLLPGLRGKLWPVRGTMSAQQASLKFPRLGHKQSWSFVHSPRYCHTNRTWESGLYYMQQNAHSGDIFIGGEKQKVVDIINADDSCISIESKENLENLLPKVFGDKAKSDSPKGIDSGKRVWSGVLGFTADQVPFVGSIPNNVTQRGGSHGEWIAAGFNGYGMPQCWSAGEAVATMICGNPVPDWLPEVFLITRERLDNTERMEGKRPVLSFFGDTSTI